MTLCDLSEAREKWETRALRWATAVPPDSTLLLVGISSSLSLLTIRISGLEMVYCAMGYPNEDLYNSSLIHVLRYI